MHVPGHTAVNVKQPLHPISFAACLLPKSRVLTHFHTMIRRRCSVLLLLMGLSAVFCAADSTVDTFYYSRVLKRNADYMVILPGDYQKKKSDGHRYPVLYLLHCAGCDHRSYYEGYNIAGLVDSFDMIIAIPFDGTSFGWWVDSPVDRSSQLSTWIAGEFKSRIDSLYPTLPGRKTTGIAGHSMGGFGAMHNLITHPEIYGAVFSAKGRLDMVSNGGGYMTDVILGDFTESLNNYMTVDILGNADKFIGIDAPIKFYTGPNDRFLAGNRAFSTLLTKRGVDHDYFENEEGHYSMTQKSMRIMLQFFDEFFSGKR
jgi:S-formylglutathione hydrolase FrmB